jgi:hypothetical protein
MLSRLALLGALIIVLAERGLAFGQTPPPPAPDRAVGDPLPNPSVEERIRQRERTGNDADMATGTFGTTGRGAAAGAADSRPAEGRRAPGGEETMSEPTGPGSAERRPGTAVTQ